MADGVGGAMTRKGGLRRGRGARGRDNWQESFGEREREEKRTLRPARSERRATGMEMGRGEC